MFHFGQINHINHTDGIIRKRSINIAGHATSVSMEEAFWTVLKEMAEAKGKSLAQLIREIDDQRRGNLSSALRLAVLEHYKKN